MMASQRDPLRLVFQGAADDVAYDGVRARTGACRSATFFLP